VQRGTKSVNGKWGAYIWAMQNTVDFKTSPTDVWVSTNGVTNVISRVLVGTIGDFEPMTDQSDTHLLQFENSTVYNQGFTGTKKFLALHF